MTRRKYVAALVLAVSIGFAAAPAAAQGRQSINFQVGAFAPLDESARMTNDVLLVNLDYLSFDIRDLRSATVSADWSVLLSEYFEFGVGAGYYEGKMPSVYWDLVGDDGFEIQQEISLRIVPVTALVKFYPMGAFRSIQPYVGGGAALYLWNYRELGDFVDLTDNSIFTDEFVQSGTSVGPVALAGIRARVTPSTTIGVEGRYQWGKAKLSMDRFLSDRLDLGGVSGLVTFGFRF